MNNNLNEPNSFKNDSCINEEDKDNNKTSGGLMAAANAALATNDANNDMENNSESNEDDVIISKNEIKIKTPKYFKKPFLTEKQFKKKVLSRIYLKNDIDFVKESFTNIAPFTFTGNNLHTKKDIKRINTIANQIKKQKKLVKIGPLAVFLSIVIVLFCGVYFFGNVILSNLMENTLEQIFKAKSDVIGFKIRFPTAVFNIKNVAVANKDAPMTNLFEVGNINASFNLLELTRGKVIIDDLTISEVQWGTERETSGALANPPENIFESNDYVKSLVSQLKTKSTSALENINEEFNPVIRLQKEIDSLDSPKIATKLATETKSLLTKYEKTIPELIPNTQQSLYDVKTILDSKPSKIESLEDLQTLYTKATEAQKLVQDTYSTFETTVKDFSSDFKSAQTLINETKNSLLSDKEHIEKIINSISSFNFDTGKTIVSDIAETYIANILDSYYPLVQNGVALVQQLLKKNDSEVKQEDKSGVQRLEGRTISFDKDLYPSFLLSNLELSVGLEPKTDLENVSKDDFYVGLFGSDITSQPKKWANPAIYKAAVVTNGLAFNASATTDLRANSEKPVTVNLSAAGISFDSGEINTSLISSLKGNLTCNAEITSLPDGKWTGTLSGNIKNASFIPKNLEGTFISDILDKVISGISSVDLQVTLLGENLELTGLEVSSNADKVIFAQIKKVLLEETEKVKVSMINYANEYFNSIKANYETELSELENYYSQITSLSNSFSDSTSGLETLKNDIQKQIEDKTKAKVNEFTSTVEDKAKEKANELADKLKKSFF